MSKIIDMQDILADAKGCIECIFMAANELADEDSSPIQTVARFASEKINEAIALLGEYRTDIGEGPVEFPKPVSPAERTKRRNQ